MSRRVLHFGVVYIDQDADRGDVGMHGAVIGVRLFALQVGRSPLWRTQTWTAMSRSRSHASRFHQLDAAVRGVRNLACSLPHSWIFN